MIQSMDYKFTESESYILSVTWQDELCNERKKLNGYKRTLMPDNVDAVCNEDSLFGIKSHRIFLFCYYDYSNPLEYTECEMLGNELFPADDIRTVKQNCFELPKFQI